MMKRPLFGVAGLSMIEILVVISILMVLSAILVP